MEKKEIRDRLAALRACMKQQKIDAYYIGTADFHGSEYVGDYFKTREYMSGFTGSAGVLVVLQEQAALWTDGRYFIQAQQQLADTGITLMRQGMEGVPDIYEYLRQNLADHAVLGMDGRTISIRQADAFKKKLEKKQITLELKQDLVGMIWKDRPKMSHEPVWVLKEAVSGRSAKSKIDEMREELKKRGLKGYLISSLDDIGWLLNLRGGDIACTPVALAYVLLTLDQVTLYIQSEAVSEAVRNELKRQQVTVAEYHSIYEDLGQYAYDNLYLNAGKVNLALLESLPEGLATVYGSDFTTIAKARKNAVEIAGERLAHERDGIALTQFLYWLKHAILTQTITEISAAEKLEEFRKQQSGYIMPSFDPIFGYGEHGAIVHYSATKESDAVLRPEGLLLMDTGGHYDVGTTDVTRTVALGPVTDWMKQCYTAVLIGHLALLTAKFVYGTTGSQLDMLAKEPLYRMGLDFRHGTGHGVGHLLCVHEGPQNISPRSRTVAFEEGMVTSDEPGYYEAGAFGIRTENLMVTVCDEKSEYGQFLRFEPLTLCPYDRSCIDQSMLSDVDKARLNAYHRLVYDRLAPHLDQAVRKWLENETKPIS